MPVHFEQSIIDRFHIDTDVPEGAAGGVILLVLQVHFEM